MAVMNDAQLSKYFDGLYLAKGILMFALSPTVIHSFAFSVLLCPVNLFCTENHWKVKYRHIVCLFIFDSRECIRNSTANFRVTKF